MEPLGVQLSNGDAALVVLVRRSTPDKVLPRISQFGGTVIQTSLDDGPEARAAGGARRPGRGRLTCDGALAAHLGSRQVARVIYGAIIGLALLVVLEQHPPGDRGGQRGRCIATAVAVGLAELYSEIVGTETRTRHRVDRAAAREFADDALAVGFGVASRRCSSCSRRSASSRPTPRSGSRAGAGSA